MKKNGFTLIEILAIIIILAIIAVITVPIILNIIDNSKKGAAKDASYGYVEAVNRLYYSNSLDGNDDEIEDGFYTVSKLKTMGVSVSGTEPNRKSWISLVDGVVVQGCLQFDDFMVNIDNGVVGTALKGVCEGLAPDPVSFASDSWKTIKMSIDDDDTDLYNVGDTKKVEIDGVLYTIRLSNKTFEGCGTIEEKFSQSACGFVFEFVDIISDKKMNSSLSNIGGWPASQIYSYLNTDIYNKLPQELKDVIADTYVVSGHGSTVGEENFESFDKLYLLSANEVYSNSTYDSAASNTKKLEYYSLPGSTKIKKLVNGSEDYWWLRSAYSNTVNSFYYSYDEYHGYDQYSNYFYGVAPAFRIVKN